MRDLTSGQFRQVFGTHARGSETIGEFEDVHLTPQFVVGKIGFIPECKTSDPAILPLVKQMIVSQYERTWVANMMTALYAPIPLDVSPVTYHSAMAKSLSDATFARAVIIRSITKPEGVDTISDFPCLGVYDRRHSMSEKVEFIHLSSDSPAFPIYLGLLDELRADPAPVRVMTRDTSPALFDVAWHYLDEPDVRTLIVMPMTLGGVEVGLLTLAYDFELSLSDVLTLAFLGVSNHAAAALENFSKINEIHDLRRSNIREYIENLQIDLLQGFRHAARNSLGIAQGNVRAIQRLVNFKGPADDNPVISLQRHLNEIDSALDNMARLKLADEHRELSNVADIFNEAVALMEYQLKEARVEVRPTVRGRLDCYLNRSYVRYAFANLLLNSIQAFDEGGIKRDRVITLVGSRQGRDITLDYSDNGPGVRLGVGTIQTFEDIWVAGKSSKKSGTGYGLPMVRQVFEGVHGGSIDLRRSSRGATFRIKLRADPS